MRACRAAILVLCLLGSGIVPGVVAEPVGDFTSGVSQSPAIGQDIDELVSPDYATTFSDHNVGADCGISSYSFAVKTAFLREASIAEKDPSLRAITTDWLAVIPGEDCSTGLEDMKIIAQQMGAYAVEDTILEHTWIISFHSGDTAEQALRNNPLVEAFHPMRDLGREVRLIPNDTKFSDQWHLRNTGQGGGSSGEDVNITGAWDSVDGSGVLIAIVDDGLDTGHDDLSPNYQDSLDYDYCSNDGNPNPSSWDGHGTSAAGVAAAYGNDNYGVTGASMDADLIGLRLIACSLTDSRESNALLHQKGSVDIYSNSWGPSDNGNTVEAPGPLMTAAFEEQAYEGRLGLGGIITFAGGNGGSNSDDSNYDGYANSRFTIGVGAVEDDGVRSYYSEPGANLLVVAPSDGGSSGITTTDIEGSGGYSNGDWTDNFGGTSSATPLVSGIIGLIFEANPNLTWRDVNHILVNTARMNDQSDSDWTINGAGHDINHDYGFGVIDAGWAVSMASNWSNVDQEVNWSSGTININTALPDNTNTWTTDSVMVAGGIKVETVEVMFDATHSYRGDIVVSLVSPDGTESRLSEKHSDSGNDWSNWVFTSNRHWDEIADGNWTLKVKDSGNGDTGTWDAWSLSIHGTNMIVDSDGDGLWDSNETEIHNTDPYNPDTDGDGLSDWDEVMVWGTDPNANDSDFDGLDDGVEVNTHGTSPTDYDSDDDGLTDGDEVNVYGSNPTVYDADADSDGYYWFMDCNDSNSSIHPGAPETLNGINDDCDEEVDEGYENYDTDQDGLNDWEEYHTYATDYLLADTDGDGLSDGDEVLIYGTDPLVADVDNDSDGYYWFTDCNDSNFYINPNAVEELNGIDDDCDDFIDENFYSTDLDGDGISDHSEYATYGTNWTNPDSDADGLDDGAEIWYYGSDPLVYDADADNDEWYHFEDCDDNNSSIYPNAVEVWNQLDDDCDGDVDEWLNPPTPDPQLTFVNAPIQAYAGDILSFNATSLVEGDLIQWMLGEQNHSGGNISTSFADAGIYVWQVCAVRESMMDCQMGSLTINTVPTTDAGGEQNGQNGTQGSDGDGGSSPGSSSEGQTDTSGLLSLSSTQLGLFAALVALVALIGFLAGRGGGRSGAGSSYSNEVGKSKVWGPVTPNSKFGEAKIPQAPTLPPPAEDKWGGGGFY